MAQRWPGQESLSSCLFTVWSTSLALLSAPLPRPPQSPSPPRRHRLSSSLRAVPAGPGVVAGQGVGIGPPPAPTTAGAFSFIPLARVHTRMRPVHAAQRSPPSHLENPKRPRSRQACRLGSSFATDYLAYSSRTPKLVGLGQTMYSGNMNIPPFRALKQFLTQYSRLLRDSWKRSAERKHEPGEAQAAGQMRAEIEQRFYHMGAKPTPGLNYDDRLVVRLGLSRTTAYKYLALPEHRGGLRHRRAGKKYHVTERAIREWEGDPIR